MSLIDWERKLRGWRTEFSSGVQLGNKALSGLMDEEVWKEKG